MVAIAPYFIETELNKDQFAHWNSDPEALELIRKGFQGKQMLKWETENHFLNTFKGTQCWFFRPDEAALKLINILNARNGSVWMIRPQQMQPFNVPDYVLPKTR